MPVQARLRHLTAAAFIPSRADATWQPLADKTAHGFVDSLSTCARPADLMYLFANPLPVQIMSRILGLPEDDAPAIMAWSDTMLPASNADDGQRDAAQDAFTSYLSETISWYRDHGAPGTLLADLIGARVGEDRLSAEELVSTVRTLILAGHEVAAHVIGHGVYSLLTTPGAWTALHASPGTLPDVVEDVLRGAVPGYGMPELVSEGGGVDYALGLALARTELRAAFGVLSARMPAMRLAMEPGDVEWTTDSTVSGPVELLVAW
jgi:cytochrome P450